MEAVHYDVFLFLFILLSYPLVAAAWRFLSGLLFSSPATSTAATGLVGVT